MKLNKYHIVGIFLLSVAWTACMAQDEAGLESPFNAIGVSAKDMGMGGAAVACPDNIGAFLFNPGGMIVVEQKRIGLSQTMLFEGTQYHFISYIHPTMTTGTFGLGISRIGVGGISHIDNVGGVPVELGTYEYWWGKISLAYAHHLFSGLSLGLNFEANRQELGPDNTNGFGLDAGLHFRTPVQSGILNNFFLGMNIKNLMQPRLKLGTVTESLPMYYRMGAAKIFTFGSSMKWAMLWDYEKYPDKKAAQHYGTELCWNNLAFIRAGLDDQDFTFGGGIRIKGIQVDYGSGPMGDPAFLPRSHRFSISLFLGKSISEQRQLIIEAQEKEIRQQVQERQTSERNKRIREGLQLGKQYFENSDYFNARLVFSRVLSEDPNNAEAQQFLAMTKEKEDAQQQQHEAELKQQSIEEEQQKRNSEFVRERYNEGLRALGEGDFNKAISKWEEALQRDPENQQIKNYIEKAKGELENEVNRLIASANAYLRQENIAQARRVLDQAKNQTENNARLRGKVNVEIQRLDNQVNFINNYQLGRENYEKGNYQAAAGYLEKALQLQPNDDQVRELYRSASQRAIGEKKPMDNEVKRQFADGLRLYSEGHYEEALAAWEKALEMDPTNIKIIDSIEIVKRKIRQMNQ